jgi:hypothetical protein
VTGFENAVSHEGATARHAGLVMTQAASIASALKVGELICPFAVITKDEKRQSIEFEATTQDEAVSKGWDSFAALKHQVDIWSLAREGLQRGAGDWNERSEAFADIKILCGACYDRVRAINLV